MKNNNRVNNNNNSVHYLLRINDEIIDLALLPGLEDAKDYLNINLFTAQYENEQDLISNMQMFCGSDITGGNVSIVKRNGNRKYGYWYKNVGVEPLYRDDIGILSVGKIREFMYYNRYDYEFMTGIMNYLKEYLIAKSNDLLTSIDSYNQENNEKKLNNQGRSQEQRISGLQNAVSFFGQQITNINRILVCIGICKRRPNNLSPVLIDDYLKRIEYLIQSICYYQENKVNYRELIRIVKYIGDKVRKNPSIKGNIADITTYNKKIEAYSEIMDYISVSRSQYVNPFSNSDIDPDTYMFLEEEDYLNLPEGADPCVDYREVDAENLVERKKLV